MDRKSKQGRIEDCECISGSPYMIKGDNDIITDIKCICANGELQDYKGGNYIKPPSFKRNVTDCRCNEGYYGGGKDHRDAGSTVPQYNPCMQKLRCTCQNGEPAKNISCSLRTVKAQLKDRITGTSGMTPCPKVNDIGKRLPIHDPNLGGKFREVSRKCGKEDQESCESCSDGFEWNKKPIKLIDGTIIPNKMTCVSQFENNSQGKPGGKQVISTDRMRQTSTGKTSKKPYKLTYTQGQSATSKRYNRMVQLNRP